MLQNPQTDGMSAALVAAALFADRSDEEVWTALDAANEAAALALEAGDLVAGARALAEAEVLTSEVQRRARG